MNSKLFYKGMAKFYDLIDVVYFRKKDSSPRKVVLDEIKDGDKVLDLCTGTATNALNIAQKKTACKVVGIDLSRDMLNVAKEKIKASHIGNLKVYCMDASKMDFKDECFDKILLSLVLHETEEELAARILAEAKRVLKDDGELIITEWERSNKLIQKLIFFPIEVLEPKTFKTFVRMDLSKYFDKNGFSVEAEDHCDYSRVLKLRKK